MNVAALLGLNLKKTFTQVLTEITFAVNFIGGMILIFYMIITPDGKNVSHFQCGFRLKHH